MTRAARFEDIKNRHDLALAERNFTQPGTEITTFFQRLPEASEPNTRRQESRKASECGTDSACMVENIIR